MSRAFFILSLGSCIIQSIFGTIDWCKVETRQDCFPTRSIGVTQDICESQPDCHWCPVKNSFGVPWCVRETACYKKHKQDCYDPSRADLTPQECYQISKCVWCEVEGRTRCIRDICASQQAILCFSTEERGITQGYCEGNNHKCVWCEKKGKLPRCVENCPVGMAIRYRQPTKCCKKKNTTTRVLGKTEVPEGRWPWMGLLSASYKFDNFTCGAVLISNSRALTAAYCVYETDVVYNVRFGMTDLMEESNENIQTVHDPIYILHPLFLDRDGPENIAILLLEPAVTFTEFVKPIALPNQEKIPLGTICFSAGFGFGLFQEYNMKLLEVAVRILPKHRCSGEEIGFFDRESAVLCAGSVSPGDARICAEDKGGPLMCQRCNNCEWYLAGIIIDGEEYCSSPSKPILYAQLSAQEDWIKSNGYLPFDTETYSCS